MSFLFLYTRYLQLCLSWYSSQKLAKKEEGDQTAAHGSEPPSSWSVIPQGHASGICSDYDGSLKLSALIKSECSYYTGLCSEVYADNKEYTSDHDKADSHVEDA